MIGEQDVRAEVRRGEALKHIVGQSGKRSRVDLEPGCAYGVVTRQIVDDLAGDLREIRGRLNSLFTLIVGAIALDIVLRVAGIG